MSVTLNHREFARLGAAARLKELDQERVAILKAFPGLKHGAAPRKAGPGGSRPGRKISPAAKRRMSAGMRRWWAKRKGKAKK